MTNRRPRLHVVPDMDWQIKFKSQTVGPVKEDGSSMLFADVRAMRDQVEGTIPFGQLEADSEMYEGIKSSWTPQMTVTSVKGAGLASTHGEQESGDAAADDVSKYVTEFPESIQKEISENGTEFLNRGQQRFNIYCSACHGYDGNGKGLVNERALALNVAGEAGQGTKWTAAKSLHDPTIKDLKQNPLGRIFETISKGRNTMGPYGAQITPKDRWAIVAYVKALHETGIKPPQVGTDGQTETDKKKDDEAQP